MRTTPRAEASDTTRQSRSSCESAKNEAQQLMAQGELEKPAWNLDSLKTALLFAKVERIKSVFEASRFCPREPGFTTLINFFGKLRDWRRAEEVFRAMTSVYGIAPNCFGYSALISACSKSGEWREALRIFSEMKEAAQSPRATCKPNAVTYSTVITACERGGQCERAVEVFRSMKLDKVVPDHGTYTAAVSSCLSTEDWKETEEILEDMHEHGFAAPSALYGDLMEKYAGAGECDKALNLFLTVQMMGVAVDIHICRRLMDCLEGGGMCDMSMDLLRGMREGGIEIDLLTFNSALRALAAAGRFSQTLSVFDSIARDGLQPDVDSVAALVKSYMNGGEVEIAEKLKEEYKERGIDIDNPIKEDVDAGFLLSGSSRSSSRHLPGSPGSG